MPVMYMEEYRGHEGLSGGIFGDIADFLGLRNPLTYYHPDLTPQQIYAKYDADLTRYRGRLDLLRSATARTALISEWKNLQPIRERIRPAFEAGARPGERDLDRLKELVVGARKFRRNLWNAETAYGTNSAYRMAAEPVPDRIATPKVPAAIAAPTGTAAAAAAAAEEERRRRAKEEAARRRGAARAGWGTWALWGGGALLALKAFRII